MRKRKNKYSPWHIASSIMMMLALAWLTISTPFVYACYKDVAAAAEKQQCEQTSSDEDCNPFSNTTEEKSHSSGFNTLSEYLHDTFHTDHHFSIIDRFHKMHTDDLYFAYDPELISPPPEHS
ncbi:hypothetical protein OCK74_23195 [Chitinophagaceae bacterium LB-8]|uniref:Uncharacterized protein n=1 Tax=Paraflavisolibacter caeni TaxID=2982496 RepID=A0A9X2XZY8_9BACT|nr:hypothetical protein [Paraflavisolibacter caeni]MCU7552046.1 hypothetical protein [Paraflavisolibacter caeni]